MVEISTTGWEIKFRSIAFPGNLTLPVRTGGGVAEASRLPTRIVKALARDMLVLTCNVFGRDAVPAQAALFESMSKKRKDCVVGVVRVVGIVRIVRVVRVVRWLAAACSNRGREDRREAQ